MQTLKIFRPLPRGEIACSGLQILLNVRVRHFVFLNELSLMCAAD